LTSWSRPGFQQTGKMCASSNPAPPEQDDLIVVGKLTRAQALKGRFRVQPEVDDLDFFRPGLQIWMAPRARQLELFEVERVELRARLVVLKVKGIDSIEQVEKYRGQLLYVKSEELPELPEDSFYFYDLIGCKVVMLDGSLLGEVKEIQPGASGELIVVKKGEQEVLIPAAKEFVKAVDITNKTLIVDLPEGML